MEKRKRNNVQSRICRLFIGICLLIVLSIPVSAIQYDPPRASNYDFDHPPDAEPDSTPSASYAANYQNASSYEGHPYTNSAAIPAWTRMADDAMFSIVGHGGPGYIWFFNGTEWGGIIAEFKGYYPPDLTDYKYLSNYTNELNDLLLATYITCNSANTSEQYGNLTAYSYQKGVDTTLGFSTNIGGLQASDFSYKYWLNFANYNWTVSTSADSAKYYAAVYNGGQFEGIQNYVIVGNPQLTIKPARYGS
jgi:hypothetical protein